MALRVREQSTAMMAERPGLGDTDGVRASARHAKAGTRPVQSHAPLAAPRLVDMPTEVLKRVCAFLCGDDVRELSATLMTCRALSHATAVHVAFLNPIPDTLCCHVVDRLVQTFWSKRKAVTGVPYGERMGVPGASVQPLVRDTYLAACQALDLPPMPHMLSPAPPRDWPRERVCIILEDDLDKALTVGIPGYSGRLSYLVEMWESSQQWRVGFNAFEQVVAPRCHGDWFQQQRTDEPPFASKFPNGENFNPLTILYAYSSSFAWRTPFEAYVTYVFALLKPEIGVLASSPRQDEAIVHMTSGRQTLLRALPADEWSLVGSHLPDETIAQLWRTVPCLAQLLRPHAARSHLLGVCACVASQEPMDKAAFMLLLVCFARDVSMPQTHPVHLVDYWSNGLLSFIQHGTYGSEEVDGTTVRGVQWTWCLSDGMDQCIVRQHLQPHHADDPWVVTFYDVHGTATERSMLRPAPTAMCTWRTPPYKLAHVPQPDPSAS